MKTGVKIRGGDVDREAVAEVASAIAKVFDSAAKNNMDQDTVQRAIDALSKLGTVSNTTISGSSFSG